MNKCILLIFGCFLTAMVSCSRIPDKYKENAGIPTIYPDYNEVTIPLNIAPLNFHIQEKADAYLTKIYSKQGKQIIVKGQDVQISEDDWKTLLQANKGEVICFEVYLRKQNSWIKYKAIKNYISEETIDNFMVYRYVQPLYTTYENMTINQRNIENFEVEILYDNRLLSTDKEEQCVNCHSFQDFNRKGNMQMHFRGNMGGTVIVQGDHMKKVNLKTEELISAPVYPCWHPTMNLIAYSVNKTGQIFHTKDLQKVEVLDSQSDLVLLDAETNKISPVELSKEWLETFPAWSPDGKDLYYSAARVPTKGADNETKVIENYQNIKYNIIRKPFDQAHKTFGVSDTVFNASAIGKSATLPRISPDGNYLLFAMGEYGNFHIWHKSSDLYVMDLTTHEYRNLEEINSQEAESYHSWSSNGRWILFASRREDGGYSRLYISYFDKNGKAHKPFVLPQENPLYYQESFRSFNIPEFIVKPANINTVNLAKTLTKEAAKATFAK